MLIDTHIHLDNERYNEDIDDVIARAVLQGVESFIIPAADPKHLERAQALAHRYSNTYFAIGVHPYDCRAYDEAFLLRFASDEKCVAVGECGLDYYRLPDDEAEKLEEKATQAEVFRAQIRLAKRLQKPLIVHIRDASHDAKMILLEEGAGEVGGVLHCFNADEELLSLANEGFYFGIGGVLTFSNAKKLVHVLPKIPREKLLLETDGPYLTPHPHRGERNEPAYVTLVAHKMAQLLDMSYAQVVDTTTQNARNLFLN
ncbi:MAG: hydrolase TatD [Sulfuricurvum sp. PC08-66]|nr:MAG: hydrolase TatD [Sulfuricurvum sp. PC08-66]